MVKGESVFQRHDRGRNLHYGIREHGMAAIMNGMALHGGVIPYGGTFLTFTDYMRGSMRLSALMKQRVIYVLTMTAFWAKMTPHIRVWNMRWLCG